MENKDIENIEEFEELEWVEAIGDTEEVYDEVEEEVE